MPAFKDTSNNTWSASFYYTDWTGQRKRKKKVGFKTRREALTFEQNFKSKAAGATTMTFGELYELYMEDARVRLKPTTYRNKEFVIKLKVLPFFKDLPISSITPAIYPEVAESDAEHDVHALWQTKDGPALHANLPEDDQ